MAGVETVSRGIPNFGPVVKRKHILNAVFFHRSNCIVYFVM